MNYKLISIDESMSVDSTVFFEGAILAANMSIKPMPVESWVADVWESPTDEAIKIIEAHFHQQYAQLMANQYVLNQLFDINNTDLRQAFARGFLSVWGHIEDQWQTIQIGDGSLRMLQGLLTSMMLAADFDSTIEHMKAAGVTEIPDVDEMFEHMDHMIIEVANTANDHQVGSKAMSVNPFKAVGRNDSCPCGSGKKYKQCCLK